jgi:hypothetical protein
MWRTLNSVEPIAMDERQQRRDQHQRGGDQAPQREPTRHAPGHEEQDVQDRRTEAEHRLSRANEDS